MPPRLPNSPFGYISREEVCHRLLRPLLPCSSHDNIAPGPPCTGYTANSNPDYNGSTVVEQSGRNLVFVNFNYRVGLWGFLADKRVSQDGDLNVGLLDQIHLLKWVKRHISKVSSSTRQPLRSSVVPAYSHVDYHNSSEVIPTGSSFTVSPLVLAPRPSILPPMAVVMTDFLLAL